jgi:hypothetical protein
MIMSEKDSSEKDPIKSENRESKKEFLPSLDFSSIVFPFYTQALFKMGILEDPTQPKGEENVELARRLIDILDLLKDRTKGNLNPDEEKFLQSCLEQLKMHYLEKAKIIKY